MSCYPNTVTQFEELALRAWLRKQRLLAEIAAIDEARGRTRGRIHSRLSRLIGVPGRGRGQT